MAGAFGNSIKNIFSSGYSLPLVSTIKHYFMRKIVTSACLVLLFAIQFCSCVPQKKVVYTKSNLSAVDSQLLVNKTTLATIDAKRQIKEDDNEIDDTANYRIKKFIANTQIEIDTLIGKNSILIGETIIDKGDWHRLQDALINSQKSLKTITDKVNFINDLIQRNTVVKLEQDVFFGPGQYKVSPEVTKMIARFFEPAAKEIDLFMAKYPTFPLSLVITAKGYADATTISETSNLYKDLKEKLKLETDNPTPAQLNKVLSNERAKEVVELFKKFSSNRPENAAAIKNPIYIYQGKGEALPYPKITDYQVDDSRRRIVLLFWSVFPD
jgi:outer membrane protein OmpA-like peptidoglycan-associated protein